MLAKTQKNLNGLELKLKAQTNKKLFSSVDELGGWGSASVEEMQKSNCRMRRKATNKCLCHSHALSCPGNQLGLA